MQYAILLSSSIKNGEPSSPTSYRFAVYGLAGPRAPLGVPVWKPFLKRREMVDRDRMRPVPVVFLRLAFSDQLSVLSENVSTHKRLASWTVSAVSLMLEGFG